MLALKYKLIAIVLLVTLIFMTGGADVYASGGLPAQGNDKGETPKELTDEEYLKDVAEFYASHPDFEITVDLVDLKGIDPSLLPEDLKSLTDSGVRIVAYRETVRVEITSGKPNGLALLCALPLTGIGCATASGSRDLTTSKVFGSVTEFARTIALRYDDYPGCGSGVNCFGWEIEKEYMWWTRSISTWNVKNGVMKTYIVGENYCTESNATLNYGSSTIAQPTWSGNQTSKYSISGFPNIAYVPLPNSGYSYTQGDIYQGTTLKYDNARHYQYWPSY